MKTIPLNKPCITGNELHYIQEAIELRKFSGDGVFTARCQKSIEESLQAKKVFLTSSGTDSLEMAALLANIEAGDEVIMPSYTSFRRRMLFYSVARVLFLLIFILIP